MLLEILNIFATIFKHKFLCVILPIKMVVVTNSFRYRADKIILVEAVVREEKRVINKLVF